MWKELREGKHVWNILWEKHLFSVFKKCDPGGEGKEVGREKEVEIFIKKKKSDPVLPIDFTDYCDLFCWGLCFCVVNPCVQLMNHFRPSMKSDWYLYLHQQISPRRKEAVGVCSSSALMSQCCEQLLASSTKRIVLKFLCYLHFNDNRRLYV